MMKRSPVLLALLAGATLPAPPPKTPEEIDRERWWLEFVREIEAIGGTVGPTLTATGAIDLKIPRERMEEAKRIIEKYKTPNKEIDNGA